MDSNIRYISNFLIIGYLITIYFSGVPDSNTYNFRMKQKTNTIAFALGIWPSWSMFAPNPIKFDSKTYVELTFKNGEIKEHDVEIELEGILSPFRNARWMKFSQDNLRSPGQQGLLRPAINYHLAKYNDPNNPITQITIKRRWWDVPEFNEHGLIPLRQKVERKQSEVILISEKVGA